MAKNTFLSFDTTASNNTDIAGIDIQGTAAVMNFDNAFRQLMAILRTDLDNGQVFVTKAAGYTALATDNNAFYEFTAAATLALTAAATLAADWHMMVFANGGAVTINPDGAELINGAATLVVADGDAAYIICTGTAFKAITIASATSVAAVFTQAYVDVASATTTDIGAAASQNVRITGTTTMTGFGTAPAGTLRRLRFAAALTLTHNATSLILPNDGSDIVTVAGDTLVAISLGSGNWVVVDYQRVNPLADLKSRLNAAGSAPIFACRAWVNFNGTGTVAIRGSGNVSSITDNGTGNYAVNFTTAMADANYCPVLGGTADTIVAAGQRNQVNVLQPVNTSASALQIATYNSSTGLIDYINVNVAVFH